jgi:multidrug efflux pump subunit AcrA (membrane-fusion protein)
MQEHQAKVSVTQFRISQCEVRAPFSGRVAQALVREHETPSPNTPLLSIVSDRDLEVHLVVPSHWLAWLKKGHQMTFSVDETGAQLSVQVRHIAATVDAVSQTVRIVGVFDDDAAQAVLPGMSGLAKFKQPAPLKNSASVERASHANR